MLLFINIYFYAYLALWDILCQKEHTNSIQVTHRKLLRLLFLTPYVIGAKGSCRILPSPRIVLKTGALIKEPYMFAY
jgi:hypothetical protein